MAQITFKCSDQQFLDIVNAAKDSNLKVATFCRKTILDKIKDQLPDY